jgi:hypothetical protein
VDKPAESPTTPSPTEPDSDEAKIRDAAMDCIRGVLEADPSRMERCLHPELADVVILDRYEGAASVRTTFDRWIDYMHIVNVGGEWKIINVLWELTPESWASRTDKQRSSEPGWPRGH